MGSAGRRGRGKEEAALYPVRGSMVARPRGSRGSKTSWEMATAEVALRETYHRRVAASKGSAVCR